MTMLSALWNQTYVPHKIFLKIKLVIAAFLGVGLAWCFMGAYFYLEHYNPYLALGAFCSGLIPVTISGYSLYKIHKLKRQVKEMMALNILKSALPLLGTLLPRMKLKWLKWLIPLVAFGVGYAIFKKSSE